jgi:hypothetical protein
MVALPSANESNPYRDQAKRHIKKAADPNGSAMPCREVRFCGWIRPGSVALQELERHIASGRIQSSLHVKFVSLPLFFPLGHLRSV